MPTAILAEPTRDGLPPMPPGPPHEERHFAAGEAVREVLAGCEVGGGGELVQRVPEGDHLVHVVSARAARTP